MDDQIKAVLVTIKREGKPDLEKVNKDIRALAKKSTARVLQYTTGYDGEFHVYLERDKHIDDFIKSAPNFGFDVIFEKKEKKEAETTIYIGD